MPPRFYPSFTMMDHLNNVGPYQFGGPYPADDYVNRFYGGDPLEGARWFNQRYADTPLPQLVDQLFPSYGSPRGWGGQQFAYGGGDYFGSSGGWGGNRGGGSFSFFW